jgi:hypothetical protein
LVLKLNAFLDQPCLDPFQVAGMGGAKPFQFVPVVSSLLS